MKLVNFDSTSMPLDMPSNPSEFSKSERETAFLVVPLTIAEYSRIAFWNNTCYDNDVHLFIFVSKEE